MRKSIATLIFLILLGGTTGYTQSRFAEFNSFREQILSDYGKFRSRVLEHYADFLEGEWHEFESIIEEESPYSLPKPELPQEVESAADTLTSNQMLRRLPDPTAADNFLPGLSTVGRGGSWHYDVEKDFKPVKIDIPAQFREPSSPKGLIEAPRPGQSGAVSKNDARDGKDSDFTFDFYGMEAFMPQTDFTIADNITGTNETGAHWKRMAAQEGGMDTARQLFGLARQLGLNGYLTFRLTESYVNQRYPKSNDKARMSAIHFLLSNMGYDVRLTKMGDIFTVMMPFDQQTVYGLFPLVIDGRTYYAVMPEGSQSPVPGMKTTLSTCRLPGDALGQTSDLRLTGLDLPMKGKTFEISHNGLTVKGTVNENIRQMLHRYPQMPTGDFASSWIDQKLRDDIVAQVKDQIAGLSETDAINRLMGLCHYGFQYATDQQQHGYEKPYFLEENFIYDFNDCEDRAIFYSYLIWNALGLPCQLVHYPGHESVTVAAVSDIDGYYYETDGTKYYCSDPTYIGSTIGMIMPQLMKYAPTIMKQYRDARIDNQ